MKAELAHLLLRRKELNEKVKQVAVIKAADVYETKGKRVKVNDSVEDLVLSVSKLTLGQVTAEYDHYAWALRMVDAAVQRANWATEVEIDPKAMQAWSPPAPTPAAAPTLTS